MTRTCEVDGCDHPCYYPGYCIRHTEEAIESYEPAPVFECIFKGCDGEALQEGRTKHGLCGAHYAQYRAGKELRPVRRHKK